MGCIADIDKSKEELIIELKSIRQLVPRLERVSAEYREAEKLQGALFAIAELASSAEDMDHFYEALHRIIGKLMYAENFYIALYEAKTGMVGFPYFADTVDHVKPEEFPYERIKRGLTAMLMRTGRSLLVTREKLEEMAGNGEIETVGMVPMVWLGVPLRREREVIGSIVVQSYTPEHGYSSRDEELLTFVSQHVSTALARKQAREELEHRVEERTADLKKANRKLQGEIKERKRAENLQSALFRITQLANAAPDMNEFYRSVHAIVSELIYAANFYISIHHKESGLLSFPYRIDEFDSAPKPRKAGRGLTEYVLRTGQPLLLGRKEREKLEKKGEVVASGHPMVGWIGIPLRNGNEITGVLAVQSYSPEHRYQARDLELLTFVSHHIASALQRKNAVDDLRQAHDELERRVQERTQELHEANIVLEKQIAERKRIQRRLVHDAFHDALTGLPNRNLFQDRLVHAIKRMSRNETFCFAVLFLDLDRFKIINDSLGHLVGDELLKEVSQAILGCMREADTVARLGGDEFAILLESISGLEDAEIIAQRILDRLDKPFPLNGQEVFTSTSIGITLCHERYLKPEDLLRDADAAMYRAKAQGRHCFMVFDESMHQHAVAQLAMESELHRAVENDEFQVYYQPIVDLRNGQIIGFEALARWQHATRGLLLPEAFLPVAQETELILSLDWCIMRKACWQLADWLEQFPQQKALGINVNLSGKHFAQASFAGRIQSMLDEFGLPAKHLKLEVDELALLEKITLLKETLAHFKAIGVQILLDDFGTRYSSLSHLHRFPMDTLKIDRSFVTQMLDIQENHAIVKTIIGLAETLEMKVVAEGIETKELLKAIRESGCQYGQGFYIARPMPAEQATALLEKGALVC